MPTFLPGTPSLGSVAYGFGVDIAPDQIITEATLIAKFVGLDLVDKGDPVMINPADPFRGARFLQDGVDIFACNPVPSPLEALPPNQVEVLELSRDAASINPNGTTEFTIIPEVAFEAFNVPEDYAVDYISLRLTVDDAPVAPVPLPASLSLCLLGLGVLAAARRLRRHAASAGQLRDHRSPQR